MDLNKNLISQFVKNTKDDDIKTKKETFVRGMIVKNDNGLYCVKIDGSDIYTPATITTNINIDQPVTVMIKNHTATVIGNVAEIEENEVITTNDHRILNSTSGSIEDTKKLIYNLLQPIDASDIQALWKD